MEYDPFGGQLNGGKKYGRGAADMKSGLAAMLVAMECIKQADVKLDGIGAEDIVKKGYLDDATAMVIGEPTDNCLVRPI